MVKSALTFCFLLACTTTVDAAGWAWFIKHRKPQTCAFGTPIVISFYHPTGHRAANGEHYNGRSMTAAHRSMPFGTRATISYGGRTITVRINDRGPYIRGIHKDKAIDLSPTAFRALGLRESVWGCLR